LARRTGAVLDAFNLAVELARCESLRAHDMFAVGQDQPGQGLDAPVEAEPGRAYLGGGDGEGDLLVLGPVCQCLRLAWGRLNDNDGYFLFLEFVRLLHELSDAVPRGPLVHVEEAYEQGFFRCGLQ